jgi:hypothetical protein
MALKSHAGTPMLPTRRPDLMARTVDDELVIFDRDRNQVHRLNTTAAYVWNSCDGRHTPSDIAKDLASDFDRAQDDVYVDVVDVINTMTRLGLLATEA